MLDNEKKICGCNLSPEDIRDWRYVSIGNKIEDKPAELDLREYLQEITDQGSQGSCVAHVLTCIKEYHEKIEEVVRKNNKLPEAVNGRLLSPQFIYNQRTIYPDPGMYPREAFKILQKNGVCFEREYRYNNETGLIEKNADILKKEIDFFKISNYARINSVDDAKKALYNDGPILVSLPVYHYEVRFWDKQISNQNIIGGHAVTFVGYEEHGFILRNSWGKRWGINGYIIYPFDDWHKINEAWSCVDVDNKHTYYNIEDKKRNEENIDDKENKLLKILNLLFCNIFSLFSKYIKKQQVK